MKELNFPIKFVQWIMECVSTTSYSIALNGQFHGHFKGQRGLRQGDPLSPFLFTLCIEVLSRSLKRMSRNVSVGLVMKCLNAFGDMAGLRVNLLKSNIYMAGVDDRSKQDIIQLTGFAPGTLPFRYLGVPLAAKKLRSSDYCKLVDAVANKINSWPRHSLSYADGGLGLKNLGAWNKALIAKTLWKIHLKKDSLWIKWVNHYFSSFGDVWNWGWHKDESPLIKQILLIRDELIECTGSKNAADVTLETWFGKNDNLSLAYDCFSNKRGKWPWKPLLNRAFILPKHRFTLWMMAHAKLLTRVRLPFVVDKSCALCNEEAESINHLFFLCKFSSAVWGEIQNWLGMMKMMRSPATVLKAFRTCYRGNSTISRMRLSSLAATVYCIWTSRNRMIFDDEKPKVEALVHRIKIIVLRRIPTSVDVFHCVE
ncbi:uncharacterized protein LOC142530599 [Primulina tabacum]|uniref:uncharacterized protein LOC142530599 n=1 Tax=Primulina tabacum TaxID=48773 RepID=UPI003F5A4F1A